MAFVSFRRGYYVEGVERPRLVVADSMTPDYVDAETIYLVRPGKAPDSIEVYTRHGDSHRPAIIRGTPEGFLAAVTKARQDVHSAAVHDCDLGPSRIGYAFVADNKTIAAVAVDDIDSYEKLALIGRAGQTPSKLANMNGTVDVEAAVTAIPINTDPVQTPYYSMALPSVGNVRVSRSADGTILYFLGDDEAAAMSIEVYGLPAV